MTMDKSWKNEKVSSPVVHRKSKKNEKNHTCKVLQA